MSGPLHKIGTVCIVTERHQETGHTVIYGVFTDEESARLSYGDQADPYDVIFDALIPLFGRDPSQETAPSEAVSHAH